MFCSLPEACLYLCADLLIHLSEGGKRSVAAPASLDNETFELVIIYVVDKEPSCHHFFNISLLARNIFNHNPPCYIEVDLTQFTSLSLNHCLRLLSEFSSVCFELLQSLAVSQWCYVH